MKQLSVVQLDLRGRRVFLRADLNVALDGDRVTDDTRIRALMPTLEHCLQAGASVVLASHLGRPEGRPDSRYSMTPILFRLEELLGAARKYLSPLRDQRVDTLILGCTHYPMLSGLIQMVMGEDVVLVSSADETAKDVYATLRSLDLLMGTRAEPRHEFLCTGDPEQFRSVAHHFLGPGVGKIDAVAVQPVRGGPWS